MSKEKEAPRAERGEGNVDQIRDILFGGQMRDYERRFIELEERLKRESERVRGDSNKRLDNLEQFVKDQLERLQAQQKRNETEFKTNLEALAQSLDKTGKAIRAEMLEADDKQSQAQNVLRDRLHKLANETSDSLRQAQDDLNSVIERLGSGLRDEKVAREELAGFFSEMALRLTRQFDLPKAKG